MGKNIKKIQDMLSGNYNKPIQVGYESTTINQREEGKRKQITKTDGVGFHKCGDCSKLILKQIDEDTWVRMGRCYYCQMDFECELKEKGKWKEWVHDQEKKRYEAVYQEIVEAVREANEAAALKGDRSVVNAINNARSKGQIK